MVEVTLHDGRTVTINMYNIGHREWKKLLTCSDEEAYPILAKVFCMTPDEVASIPPPDFNKLVRAAGKISNGEYDDNDPS